MVEFTPWMLALLCLYWLAHRDSEAAPVTDVLALNWAVNQTAVMIAISGGWGGPPVFVFWVVDVLACAWLILCDGSKLARRAAKWFAYMLALNAVIWALGTAPVWHYYTLLGLAFGQAIAVLTGIWGHGILAFYHHSRDRVRHKLADAVSFVKGSAR